MSTAPLPSPRLGAHRCLVGDAPATLRWTEWGPPDGEPVVCVHGLTRTGRDFDDVARALAARGRRVLCLDIFGRGVSDWLPRGELYTVPNYVLALLPVLEALGRPYDWVGTSMGGLIGMPIAAMPGSRLRRLVLNDVGPVLPAAALARIGAYVGQRRDFADLDGVERYLRAVHAPFGRLSDAGWRHLAETSARQTADGRMVLHYDLAIAEPFAALPAVDTETWPLWDAIAQPTLVVCGVDDHDNGSAADLAALLPNGTLVEVPGNHMSAVTTPKLGAAIRDYLVSR